MYCLDNIIVSCQLVDNLYDNLKTVTTYESMFGSYLSEDEVRKILSRYPASQWLDLATKVESFLLVKEKVENPDQYLSEKFFSPRILTILQCCTSQGLLFIPSQLNLLRKLAIVYGGKESASEVPMEKDDIAIVFLAMQDFNDRYDKSVMAFNGTKENFYQFVIRSGYMNNYPQVANLFVRAQQMYLKDSSENDVEGKNFADFFCEKVGIGVGQAMALTFALANPFFQDKERVIGQTTIIDIKTFFAQLSIDQSKVDAILKNLVIDFDTAKQKLSSELDDHDFCTIPYGYNLDVFSKTPLVHLGGGKLICVNLLHLLQKTTQNLIWMPRRDTGSSTKLVNQLTAYRGRKFEEYVKYLCETMAKKNPKIYFHYISPESTVENEEVGDCLLIQDDALVIIEAKSRQFKEGFKCTGDWKNDELFVKELMEKAAKQIEKAAKKIMNRKVDALLQKVENVKRIYPQPDSEKKILFI